MNITRCLPILALFSLAGSALANDLKSGPDKGAMVPELNVYDATGEHQEKEVDCAAERKDKPTSYVFVQAEKWSRPMNRFLKMLDESVKMNNGDYIVAVWLTDKADESKEYLPKLQQSVKYEATALTCYTGEMAGPKGWNINADAHVTVVVVNKGKVAATRAYQAINETDVPAVEEALKKAKEKG
jgi:hypothetical protein